ncbi:MAG: alpha/beta hydrolase [Gemmatimonadaceae bacterium]|nr:alpha/beta hydrolase [Gemmatimonadaceae bacterium]
MPGEEPRLPGRLHPSAMFPARRGDIHVRPVRLASGITLRVAESGEASNAPVLLVHGWGASLYMWRDWFAPLAAGGRHALAVDLPGHGLSDKPPEPHHYQLPAMSKMLRELLDALALDSVDIVAQSMAGTIALELIAEGEPRIRRLVLVNPAFLGRIRMARLGRMLSPLAPDWLLPRLLFRAVIARTHRMVYGDASRLTRESDDEHWAPSQFPSYARAMRRLVREFDFARPPLPRLVQRFRDRVIPVLFVLGTRDRLVLDAARYAAALSDAVPHVRVRYVVGGGHAVNEERPEEVVPAVLEFLGSQ